MAVNCVRLRSANPTHKAGRESVVKKRLGKYYDLVGCAALPPVLWTHQRVNVIRLKSGGVLWEKAGNTVSLTGSSSLRP
ncbi:hypothetical protein METP3_00149 [Methanosarcinales archaeon]|nr:hypothetical protein METP3_00149 [Methanosarcinales archaeon]